MRSTMLDTIINGQRNYLETARAAARLAPIVGPQAAARPAAHKPRRKRSTAKFPRELALAVAHKAVNCQSLESFATYLSHYVLPKLEKTSKRGTWYRQIKSLARAVKTYATTRDEYDLPYGIFQSKNSKVPFSQFSVLPIVTCPGRGDCENWCYSLRAWRFSGAYLRQLQNTLLIRFGHETIAKAFLRLPQAQDVRLYVDGDIDSVDTLEFWFKLCFARPDLRVYGYSKSWQVFLTYAELTSYRTSAFPTNYALNISSGSRYSDAIKARMRELPCTRGEFVAVKIDRSESIARGVKRYSQRAYHAAVRTAAREEYGPRVVSCPGKCGDCGSGRHMCGNSSLVNLVIAIGIH